MLRGTLLKIGVVLGLGGLSACNPGAGLAVLIPGAFSPCSFDGTLVIHLSDVGAPSWNGTTLWRDHADSEGYRGRVPGGTVEVAFIDSTPDTKMKLAGVPLEVYRGGARLEVPWHMRAQGRADGACGYAQVARFDLRALPPGEYTLVHRRASGVNGQVSCGTQLCTWGTFEGQEALVTQLVLPGADKLPPFDSVAFQQAIRVRTERLQSCYASTRRDRADEEVEVSLRIRADRAYGLVDLPVVPDVSPALRECITNAFARIPLEQHPANETIERLRIRAAKRGSVEVAPAPPP